jgi:putative transposase
MGARMLHRDLQREGVAVGQRHIATLMRRMGIQALAPQPGTSKKASGHNAYPYLLRRLAIERSIRSGRWTRPTSRWRAASSTSRP